MEMLPLSRRFQQLDEADGVFAEDPLLEDYYGGFRDEFHVQRSQGGRQRRRRKSNQMMLPMATATNYRPPTMFSEQDSAGVTNPDYIFWSGPPAPSFRRSIQSQRPTLENKSPVLDSAGFLSYGMCCCQCVRTQEIGITENFGQFKEILEPGLYCMAWPYADIAGRMSLRIQQLDVLVETKTKDDVFVHLQVAVQYRVMIDRAYDAYYRLADPGVQIQSFVFDVVRAAVPRLTLDETFAEKKNVCEEIQRRLSDVMEDYGYEIVTSLVTDIMPDPKVKASMNQIQASRRLKEAMPHRAEAEKVKVVKKAEAEAESLYLSGNGIAKQRMALAEGLKTSVNEWTNEKNLATKDVMDLLLITQYVDTLNTVGANSLIACHHPGEVFRMQQNLPTTENVPDLLT